MSKAAVTNQRVAEDLSITHSAVSRIRSGDRLPSVHLMIRIREVFDWGITEQAMAATVAEGDQSYKNQFERVLEAYYG